MAQFIADQIRVNHNPGVAEPSGEEAVQSGTAVRANYVWTDEAIRMLGVAFPWHQTLEGEAFWFDIVKRLHRIKDKGR